MKSMDSKTVLKAMKRLGELASEEGLHLECCIYGGALMMLAYNARTSTKDVDAVLCPRDPALRLADRVAKEMNLPRHWLNDQVRTFLAPSGQFQELPIDLPGLHITAPTAGYLLAMKALACRTNLPGFEGDLNDLRYLIQKLQIRSIETIQHTIDKYYPDDVIPAAQKETLNELIREVWS